MCVGAQPGGGESLARQNWQCRYDVFHFVVLEIMYADEEFRCGRVCHPQKAIFKTDSVSFVAIKLPDLETI